MPQLNVVVREARESDREPLMNFVAKTWGGHDYIPSVWDEWMRDERGKVFVVEVDGQQVGMNRVRFLNDGAGWLEGARIRPDFRGRGLASLLGKRAMEYASGQGVTTFRLTSRSQNIAAHRQVGKMGFTEVAKFDVFKRDTARRLRRQAGVRRVSMREMNRVTKTIQASDEYRLGRGLYWDVFVVSALDRNALTRLIEMGRVFSAKDRTGSDAVAIAGLVKEGDEAWQQISFLCGNPSLCRKLVSHLSINPRAPDGTYAFLPHGSKLSKTMREIGLKKNFQMLLFEKRLS